MRASKSSKCHAEGFIGMQPFGDATCNSRQGYSDASKPDPAN
jgi:hypothetical protein